MQTGPLRVADFFSGLGGFTEGLGREGHIPVFACESDPELAELYRRNFGLAPEKDIREIEPEDVPPHDILTAGFPCQPFSKAGKQRGLACQYNGDLLPILLRIIAVARPRYVLLENVPNFERQHQGQTWRALHEDLRHAGYKVHRGLMSPHQYGLPQVRERLFILAERGRSDTPFGWPQPYDEASDIETILEDSPEDAGSLSQRANEALDAWEEFIERYPKDRSTPSVPIWAMEFGATYPVCFGPPANLPIETLKGFRGSFGQPIEGGTREEVLGCLPPYVRGNQSTLPEWKIGFIQANRELFELNQPWLGPWRSRVLHLPASYQKFEWNLPSPREGIRDGILQFRGSGIRLKSREATPSLVAMSSSQVPLLGWERRFLSVRECARLQDLHRLEHLPDGRTKALRALGNSVNAWLVQLIARSLRSRSHDRPIQTAS